MKYNDYKSTWGDSDMDYLTVKEAGAKWGITSRMVNYYCTTERIAGALKKGNLWLIPINTDKPVDCRTRGGRKSDSLQK